MKLRKTLVAPLAVLLLVGAAGAVLATSAMAPAAHTGGVIPAAASPTAAPSTGVAPKPLKDDAVDKVLGDLVTKGTITADQKAAILEALAAERAARQAERQKAQAERRTAQAERKALREKVKGFLADGVITQDELDQLPADHPLRQLTSLMDDGKITLDELRSVGRGLLNGLGVGGKHGWMRGGKGGSAPGASASPTTSG